MCGPCAPLGIRPSPPGSPRLVAGSGPPSASLEVVTYNLFWWNVAQNNNWDALYRKVDSQSFDLIGFQESDNVGQIINGVGRMRGRFDSYTPPGMLINPVAWDSEKFEQLDAGWRQIGSDRWGVRITAWVRLIARATGATVFFANTHGPADGGTASPPMCSTALGENWWGAVTDNIVPGDMLVYTGDFNCGAGSAAVNVLDDAAGLNLVANGGIDMIFTNGAEAASWRSVNGYPSDHPLVAASFEAAAAALPSPSPSSSPSPSPSPPPLPSPSPSPPPSTSPPPTLRCGVVSCDDATWATLAAGPGVTASCGARIIWLQVDPAGPGMGLEAACTQVAVNEFPSECGACNPTAAAAPIESPRPPPPPPPPPPPHAPPPPQGEARCGAASCTDAVWNTLATDAGGQYSCGSRISWLRRANGGGMAETAACERVASVEFPAECGGCDPAGQPATWTLHASTNCYAGFGAEDLESVLYFCINRRLLCAVRRDGGLRGGRRHVDFAAALLPTRVCGAFLLRGRLCRLRHVHHAKGAPP